MERQDCLRVFTHNSGFIFVGDALVGVKFIYTSFKYDHTEDNEDYFVAKTKVQLPDGSFSYVKDYNKVYDSFVAYKEKNSAETSYKKLFGEEGSVSNDVLGWKFAGTIAYWTLVNGEPVRKIACCTDFRFNYETNKFETDEQFPKNIYHSREECISYSDIKVISKDGDVAIKTGINKMLQLDPDQEELLGRLENLLLEMKNKNIYLLQDCCERICAFNFRNVENYKLNLNLELSDGDVDPGCSPLDYEIADRYGDVFHVDTHCAIETWGDDQNFFIKRRR